MTSNLAEVCYHEAGHAVAAAYRPSCRLKRVNVYGPGNGYTSFSGPESDSAFVAYAGVWAEARAAWEVDDDGNDLDDHIVAAMLVNHDHAVECRDISEQQEAVWKHELEGLWPPVQSVAALLEVDGTAAGWMVQYVVDTAFATVGVDQ